MPSDDYAQWAFLVTALRYRQEVGLEVTYSVFEDFFGRAIGYENVRRQVSQAIDNGFLKFKGPFRFQPVLGEDWF